MTSGDTPIARLALAGGSGLVGRALVHLAEADAGCQALHLVLRRDLPELRRSAKTQVHLAGFAAPLPALDAALCALGTTIKVAGSQDAFRAVDHDAVLAFAQAAQRAGARRFGLVSALGADARSAVFYNRVKGETEAALRALGFESLAIARPSLLLGDRAALGQPERFGERVGQVVTRGIGGLIPARWRPVQADTVARALWLAVRQGRPGCRVLESDELQALGRR